MSIRSLQKSRFSRTAVLAALAALPLAALPARAGDPEIPAGLQLPLFFTETRDEAEGAARFAGRAQGFSVLCFDDRLELVRAGGKEGQPAARVALRFAGARVTPRAQDPLPAKVHVFSGEEADWRTNLRTCAAVVYPQLWPGIDLVVHHRAGELEYDLVLAPGADLAQVALRVEGADAVRLDGDGAMVLTTALGELRQRAPKAWEVAEGGSEHAVASRFVLRGDATIGFEAERLDETRLLMVDPVLSWGTYFGSNGRDVVSGCAVDASGHVYICGETDGVPTTPGAYQTSINPYIYGRPYVAKFNPDASGAAQLVWCTYLGGNTNHGDTLGRIALGPAGEVVLAGSANTLDYPMSPNPYSTTGGGVLSVLSNDGSSLLYSTRLSIIHIAALAGLLVEADGRIVIGFNTLGFSQATTPGAFQSGIASSSEWELWFARFDRSLSGAAQLVWGTHFGGIATERMRGMSLTPGLPGVITFVSSGSAATPHDYQSGSLAGGCFVIGQLDPSQTGSAQKRFVRLYGDNYYATDGDVAVASDGEIVAHVSVGDYFHLLRLSADGAMVLQDWPWYPGSSPVFDSANVLLSPGGAVTLCGSAGSSNLPVTAGALVSSYQGDLSDGYVCQLDPATQQILFASFLGGGGRDYIYPGCAHVAGNVLTVAVSTASGSLPLQNHYLPYDPAGGYDAYLARLELPAGGGGGPGVGPRDLELLDLDGDGDLDAATANEGSDNLSLRINDGQGVFGTESTVSLTGSDVAPVALSYCDLDDDGSKDDLALACEGSSTVVLVTNPSSTTPSRVSLSVSGLRPSCVASGDLDGDPHDDVVVGCQGEPFAGGSGLSLHLNGGAALSLAISSPHPTQVVRVALGDLDGDGDHDLAALAQGSPDQVLLFASDGAGTLTLSGTLALSTSGLSLCLSLSDLDGDGRLDLAVAQPELFPPAQSLRIFRRTSSGALSSSLFTAVADLSTSGAFATDLASGDLEDDGIAGFYSRIDLALANAGSGTVSVHHGFDGASFLSSSSPSAGTNPIAVAIGDLNADGCDDLVVANQGSSDLTVHLTSPPALAQSYGASCGGPLVSAVGTPSLGNATFAIRIGSARPIAPALLFFSFEPAQIALLPSACFLYFQNPIAQLLLFTSSSGEATLRASIPNAPDLLGGDVYFQGAVFRVPGGAFASTLDLSDGLRVQVGQ